MQRREQQRRTASLGGSLNSSSPSYLGVGGGISGYSPIPRFEPAEPSPIARGMTPAAKSPAFKGSGMKLGSAKKTKQAELLDALGGEVLATTGLGVEERTAPTTPTQAVSEPTIQKASGRGSVPEVEAERCGNSYTFESINWAHLFAAYTSSSRNKYHSPSSVTAASNPSN